MIHAGIYYPRDSAKAAFCRAGREALYAFCASHGVAHRRLGKIIVAGAAEAGRLEGIAAAAAANGVDDLAPLDAGDLARMEPALRGVAGLLSPSTGIIDSHGYMLALQGEAEVARSDISSFERLHRPGLLPVGNPARPVKRRPGGRHHDIFRLSISKSRQIRFSNSSMSSGL